MACCNYAARALGVRNGVSMRRAKEACPNLVVIPYEFDVYREVVVCSRLMFTSHVASCTCSL